MTLIQRTINNRQLNVSPNATVLQACELAGIEIPRFCYHEKLSVAGNCRRCLVEIQKSPKPVVSCARPVTKGRIVFTDTPLVRKARESVLEFLLVNHPLDCPICDQGGECDLQDEAITYGTDRGRYFEFKRSVEDKKCSPIVKTIRTRCIHCTRCVRFSTEVAGNEVMGAFGRGENIEISLYVNSFIKTELSGNLVDLCPVGALTTKPIIYQARNWELQSLNTLDFFDVRLSDIVVYKRQLVKTDKGCSTAAEEIQRILPNLNGSYSHNWITDRTRYAFDGLNYDRLSSPYLFANNKHTNNYLWNDVFFSWKKTKKNNWKVGKAKANNSIQQQDSIIVGSHSNLERVYAINIFIKIKGNNNISFGYRPAQLRLDQPFSYSLNRTVSSFIELNISGFLMIGTNLAYEASLINTMFRREQNLRNNFFVTIGAFTSLRYKQSHQGNSFRALIGSIENRYYFIAKNFYNINSIGILLSVNSLRNQHSIFLQKIIHSLGKFFFVKTGNQDRLGYLHNSVGSLSAAHFGLVSKRGQGSKKNTLFSINRSIDSESFFNRISKLVGPKATYQTYTIFDTNFPSNFEKLSQNFTKIQGYPLTSFYEIEGHVISIEGQKRKHIKVVTPPSDVRSLESVLSLITRLETNFNWLKWNENLTIFNLEVPTLLEMNNLTFKYNPYQFNDFNFNVSFAKYMLFTQPVKNFYQQEPIAINSNVMAECALFLGENSNFIQEN